MQLSYCCLALCTVLTSWCAAAVVNSKEIVDGHSMRLNRRAGVGHARWPLKRLSDNLNGLTGVAIDVTLPIQQQGLPGRGKAQKWKYVLKLNVGQMMSWVFGYPLQQSLPDLNVRSLWYPPMPVYRSLCVGEPIDFLPYAKLGFAIASLVEWSFGGSGPPPLERPIAMVTMVEGTVKDLPYTAVGDGELGLSPASTLGLVSVLNGRQSRNVIFEGSQLLLSLTDSKLEISTYNSDADWLWFGLATDDPAGHWTVRSKRPSSEQRPAPNNGGQVQFATHHRSTMLAHNLVNDYFEGWPLLHTERDPPSGMHYVDCNAGDIAPPLELLIENNVFVVQASDIIGQPAPAYQGYDPDIIWCHALLQEIPEDMIVEQGIWLSLGLAFMETHDIVFDPTAVGDLGKTEGNKQVGVRRRYE